MKIIDKDSFIKWISISLGEPIIRVELALPQYEVIIDHQLDIFHRWVTGEGTIYEYGIMELKAGQTEYNLRSMDNTNVAAALGQDGLPDPAELENLLNNTTWENSYINIQDVLEVKSSGGYFAGINSLFTPGHGWFYYMGGGESMGLQPGYLKQGTNGLSGGDCGIAGGPDSGMVTSGGMTGQILGAGNTQLSPLMPLSDYVMMRQNLAMLDHLFGERKQAIWRPDAGILRIYPTPYRDDTAMVRYYKKEQAVYLYNNPLFQDLVVNACGVHWGNNLKKYGISMAGGGSVNGDAIYSQYKTDYDATFERLKNENWKPFHYIG